MAIEKVACELFHGGLEQNGRAGYACFREVARGAVEVQFAKSELYTDNFFTTH